MKYRYLPLLLLVFALAGCDSSGDRVLVAKFVYDSKAVPPRRYDVVVFKYPKTPVENGTPKNYIKRLLGLPGEIIAIFFGHLYRFPVTPEGIPAGITREEWDDLLDTTHCDPLDLWKGPDPWAAEGKTAHNYMHPTAQKLWALGKFEILRKPPHVMLALSRPVFDNDHQAKDLVGVLPERWAPQGVVAWAVDGGTGFHHPGNTTGEQWLRYRHVLRPTSEWGSLLKLDEIRRKEKIAEIAGRPHWPQLITDFLGYNSFESARHSKPAPNWAGDLMLECNLTVSAAQGEFWMEVNKGVDRFQARFDLTTGVCTLYRNSEHAAQWQPLASAQTTVKGPGTYALRFANFDERLTVWVGRELPFGDGKEYAPPAKVGPDPESAETEKARANNFLDGIKNNDLQPAGLCSVGAVVEVRNIKLLRNTYYTGFKTDPRGMLQSDHHPQITGEDWKLPRAWGPLRDLKGCTIYVYPGHYLCMGDNSQESSDGREWGLVPERLMLGRALLVYFPFDRAGTIK
jgi:signal peptidase I